MIYSQQPCIFCGQCLQEVSKEDLQEHCNSREHKANAEKYRERVDAIFDIAETVLAANEGSWERCFDCGATRVDTVVILACPYCDGGGGREPAEGTPGVPFQNGNTCIRFTCKLCAKKGVCMSCGTLIGGEDLYIDTDAREASDGNRAALVQNSEAPLP